METVRLTLWGNLATSIGEDLFRDVAVNRVLGVSYASVKEYYGDLLKFSYNRLLL